MLNVRVILIHFSDNMFVSCWEILSRCSVADRLLRKSMWRTCDLTSPHLSTRLCVHNAKILAATPSAAVTRPYQQPFLITLHALSLTAYSASYHVTVNLSSGYRHIPISSHHSNPLSPCQQPPTPSHTALQPFVCNTLHT